METNPENLDETFIIKDFKQVDYDYSTNEIDIDSYYDDPALNQVLTHYQDHIEDSHVLIPITGIRCIQRLLKNGNRINCY